MHLLWFHLKWFRPQITTHPYSLLNTRPLLAAFLGPGNAHIALRFGRCVETPEKYMVIEKTPIFRPGDFVRSYIDMYYAILERLCSIGQIPTNLLTTFCPQFKFDGNFALLYFHCLPSDRNNFCTCHVETFVTITVFEPSWEWNEISIEFESRLKKVSEMSPTLLQIRHKDCRCHP